MLDATMRRARCTGEMREREHRAHRAHVSVLEPFFTCDASIFARITQSLSSVCVCVWRGIPPLTPAIRANVMYRHSIMRICYYVEYAPSVCSGVYAPPATHWQIYWSKRATAAVVVVVGVDSVVFVAFDVDAVSPAWIAVLFTLWVRWACAGRLMGQKRKRGG